MQSPEAPRENSDLVERWRCSTFSNDGGKHKTVEMPERYGDYAYIQHEILQ